MRRHDSGFSLVELMVAMTVTLIVSGAIYGLLTSGSNAFRREPELADRQQNIRIAMDLVARDVFNAGANLPTFSQVFTDSDPGGACTGGLNGCGAMGTLGSAAKDARAPGDVGDPSENTDVLELVTTDEQCPPQSVCPSASSTGQPGLAGLVVTREGVPSCMRLPGFALLTDGGANTYFVLQPAQAVTGTPAECSTDGSTARNGNLTLSLPPTGFRVPGATMPAPASSPPPETPAVFLYQGRVVRYRIAPSNDPTDSSPALWRSETGRYDVANPTVVPPEPGEAGFPGANSPWELVARGVEDLQVEYMPGDRLWHNLPPVSTLNDWDSIVRQVRITLSARSSATNIQGMTTAGGGAPDALRGQLSTTVTPRAAFSELQTCRPNCPEASQIQ